MIPSLRILILALAVAAVSSAQAADLLLRNVNGYTLDGRGDLKRFQAMLVSDGKVVATGSDSQLAKRANAAARVVDGEGHTLLPGLIDAHGHVMSLGYAKAQADLAQSQTLADALSQVKAFAASNPKAPWIRGGGWNQEVWKLGRFPTARELDAVTGDTPAWLERVDGHAGWANSAAMKRAGIGKDTRDPPGGKIERDSDGNATGIFIDAAGALISDRIPPPTAAQASVALDLALAEMARVGVTSVGDAGIDAETFALYKRYADQGKLSARIYAMIRGTETDFDRIAADGPLIGYGGAFLTVRSVKLFADGALGSRGAALLAPYSDDTRNSGLLFHDEPALTAMIGKGLARGYQLCVHAIGDRANREVLDSFEAAYKRHGGDRLRNRIEHAQVVALEDIPRFVPLKLVASMQPTHATSDMNMAEQRVGPQRIKGAYAWQRFLKQGTVVAGGSDFPVESPNPFYGLHAAVTRKDHQGHPAGGWYPQQDMSLAQALRAFTLDAAYAQHQEKTLGTLEPGKWADFILIDRDIFSGKPDAIWSTRVLQTWVGGRQVHPIKH